MGLPSALKMMTTADLMHTPFEVLNSRAISSHQAQLEDAGEGWEPVNPRREIPPGAINHLLLLPGSMGGRGWMHAAATYLLLRNETLFHHDAWMGTMAATVCYLLMQVSPRPRLGAARPRDPQLALHPPVELGAHRARALHVRGVEHVAAPHRVLHNGYAPGQHAQLHQMVLLGGRQGGRASRPCVAHTADR